MLRLALVLAIFWVFQPTHTRASVQVVYEDIECSKNDERYFKHVDAYLSDDNAVMLNMTIVQRLPEDADCHMVMYGSSMGEFILPSGIDVSLKFCEMLSEPVVLGPILEVLGFEENDCPPPPGVYSKNSYKPSAERFPEDFMPNKYLLSLTISMGDDVILKIELTLNIS